MEISFCPQCGTRRLRMVRTTGWKYECPDCLEVICILPMPVGKHGLILVDQVEPMPELDFIQGLLDSNAFGDKGVSL